MYCGVEAEISKAECPSGTQSLEGRGVQWCPVLGSLRSLTHHAVVVRVIHVRVGGCPRRTGAMPWLRTSAQVMRPFPLSS